MDAIKAVVQNVIPQGRHGPFAIATSEKVEGSITFSLKENVWQEQEWPEQGMVVALSNLRKKRAGWRAMSGRFLRPSDEQPAISKSERSRTMKVCSCCHCPEVISGNPVEAMFQSCIVVPDDTPVERGGMMESGYISPKVLEDAGLKWDGMMWCQPDGEIIMGAYDITVTEGREMEDWERALFANKTQMMIPYLKSYPKDDSTLGSGNHTKRQARALLKLFGEYVLGAREGKVKIPSQAKNEFAGSYGTTKEIELEEPGLKGFDFEGLERIRKAIQQDQQKLAEMGLEPTSDDERAKQYCYKLYLSLEANLSQLEMTTRLTQMTYDIQDKGPEGMRGVGLFLATFASRHHTDQTGCAVRNLYGAMLPILLSRLAEAGFADTEMEVAWDYGESPKAHGVRTMAMAAKSIGAEFSAAIVSKARAKCQQCGHEVDVEIHEDQLEKGQVRVTGIPDVCPNCQNVPQSPEGE